MFKFLGIRMPIGLSRVSEVKVNFKIFTWNRGMSWHTQDVWSEERIVGCELRVKIEVAKNLSRRTLIKTSQCDDLGHLCSSVFPLNQLKQAGFYLAKN